MRFYDICLSSVRIIGVSDNRRSTVHQLKVAKPNGFLFEFKFEFTKNLQDRAEFFIFNFSSLSSTSVIFL